MSAEPPATDNELGAFSDKTQPACSCHVETVTDPMRVQEEVNAWAVNCRDEVLTMQPGGRRKWADLQATIDRDASMLSRGVRLRIVYHQAVRTDYAAQKYARHVSSLGAEIRTTPESFERLIVFDRKVAFVPMARTACSAPGAVIIKEPTVVAFLMNTFEARWLSSNPFDPYAQEPDQITADQRAMLVRLMAEGLKDDVIARRLGLATRTCRRYIAELMAELGATSRFQAGIKLGRMGIGS